MLIVKTDKCANAHVESIPDTFIGYFVLLHEEVSSMKMDPTIPFIMRKLQKLPTGLGVC
jgi:hypothetical protein